MRFSRNSLLLWSIVALAPFHLNARLIFAESFDRPDGSATKDAIGSGWSTNSAWRADGGKQTFLQNGHLAITRLEKANHAVSVKRDFLLNDCTVSVRFKLGEKDRLGINFNDPGLKTSHAGHVCSIRVTPTELSVADQMNGSMNLKLRERRQAGETSLDLKAAIEKTEARAVLQLKPNRWHELVFQLEGDSVRVHLNGVFQLAHKSPGFGHPTKRNIALSVPGNATVDDFQVWDQAGKK